MSQEVLAALEKLEASVLEIEDDQQRAADYTLEAQHFLEELKRHCAALGLRDLEQPCHWVGSLLEMLNHGKARPDQEMVDLLLGPIDLMRRLVFLSSMENPAEHPAKPAGAAPPEKPAPPPPPPAEPVSPAARKTGGAIKVDTAKLDALLNVLGELVITHALSSRHSALALEQNHALQENLLTLGEHLENLERQVAAIRMLPLGNLFMRMQRLVRDVSAKVGKKAELLLQGGEIELDKGLIEELNDPLVHLLRNALDHGAEPPEERQAKGKPAVATLKLAAQRLEHHMVITVSDDGRGLNRDRILAKGLEKGLVSPGRSYSDQQVFQLILEPGFSTASQVTDISGRGVGMDVVARAVAQMGAEITINSAPDQGSTFTISLPLNRVVSDGITEAILVLVGGEVFGIPSRQVIEVVAHDPARVFDAAGESVVDNRGAFIPLMDMARVMDCHRDAGVRPGIIIIVKVAGREIAFLADELIGHQQVVLRSLEKRAFPTVTSVSGCAMTGDQIGLMLDLEGLAAGIPAPAVTA